MKILIAGKIRLLQLNIELELMHKMYFQTVSIFFTLSFAVFACSANDSSADVSEAGSRELEVTEKKRDTEITNLETVTVPDSISISKIHKPNFIVGDFDGDQRRDTVQMVLNKNNGKYGLKIIFGTGKTFHLGLGKEVLKQGFDDLDWVGIFEKVPKGAVHYNNVVGGEIISDEEVDAADLITLPNDGIYIHAAESCGGGIIYLKNGRFEWIQQE